MNQRERILVLALSLILVGGFVFVLYTIAVEPMLTAKKNLARLQDEADTLEQENKKLTIKLKRMDALTKRSLPANIDVARQQYESALSRALKEAKITSGFTLREQSPEAPPEIEKGRPAYRKLTFQINISKVDIGSVMTFMKKYYDMNLLHHLTFFQMKRLESTASSKEKKDTPEARKDLEITLRTEALILDSAINRTSLYSIPNAFGSIGGGPGWFGLQNSPRVALGIRPEEIDRILALPDRDYALVTYRDVFHGPYPAPEPPKKNPPPPPPPDPPKKPDVSPYIKLTTLIQQSTGVAQLYIKDVANNIDYDVTLTQRGERLVVDVEKSQFDFREGKRVKDKEYPRGGILALSDNTSSTNRTFKIHGLDGGSLILSEKQESPLTPSKTGIASGTRPTRPGFGTRPAPVILPPPDPKAAVIGGLIVARPKDDLIFAWDVGQPLSRLRALTKTEGKKAIERASFGLFEPPPQGPLTVVPDPMPMTPPEPQSTREVLPAPRSGLLPIE